MRPQRIGTFLTGVLFVGVSIGGAAWLHSAQAAVPLDPIATEHPTGCGRRPIDLVICLDTSGSMEQLIDSARARLWDIVCSLGRAKPTPQLRVGLLTYGSPSRSTATAGWVVRQFDLTSDLDSVYSRMMGFSTDGGAEFVGWVLSDAVRTMSWSGDPRALKLIFVAGNESADQAGEIYNFREVAAAARAKGIIINAIYAGDRNVGINEHWQQVAAFGGGSYSAIDMRCGTVQIDTPQDKLLFELNMKLNATYLPYGEQGADGLQLQQAQDRRAREAGAATEASRIAAKATPLYGNSRWDLVDAVADGDVEVRDLEKDKLPPVLRELPPEEREAQVAKMRADRADIQRQITEAQAARETYLRDARKKASDGKAALDDAMLEAIRTQAEANGFSFE